MKQTQEVLAGLLSGPIDQWMRAVVDWRMRGLVGRDKWVLAQMRFSLIFIFPFSYTYTLTYTYTIPAFVFKCFQLLSNDIKCLHLFAYFPRKRKKGAVLRTAPYRVTYSPSIAAASCSSGIRAGGVMPGS